jgi:hypothetical protein
VAPKPIYETSDGYSSNIPDEKSLNKPEEMNAASRFPSVPTVLVSCISGKFKPYSRWSL